MTAKQWLRRYEAAVKDVDKKLEIRQDTYDRLTKITAQLSGESVSSSHDPHKFDELAALDDYIRKRVLASIATQSEIMAAVDELEDWRLRDVLEYRYVKLCTWEGVADAMSFSRQHVTRLHGMALVAIKPIIEKRCACLLQ